MDSLAEESLVLDTRKRRSMGKHPASLALLAVGRWDRTRALDERIGAQERHAASIVHVAAGQQDQSQYNLIEHCHLYLLSLHLSMLLTKEFNHPTKLIRWWRRPSGSAYRYQEAYFIALGAYSSSKKNANHTDASNYTLVP